MDNKELYCLVVWKDSKCMTNLQVSFVSISDIPNEIDLDNIKNQLQHLYIVHKSLGDGSWYHFSYDLSILQDVIRQKRNEVMRILKYKTDELINKLSEENSKSFALAVNTTIKAAIKNHCQ